MKHRVYLAALLIFALTSSASADLQFGTALPAFSAEEQLIIARNRSLRDLAVINPELVRRALDAIAASSTTGSREARIATKTTKSDTRDPDLDGLARSSPEASHDLMVLIKKAAAGKK